VVVAAVVENWFQEFVFEAPGPKLKTGLKRTDQTLHKRPAFCYLTTSSVTSSVSGAPPLALHRRSKAGRIQEPSGSRNGCVRVPRSCSVAYIKISTSISMGIDIRTSISVCVCVCVCVCITVIGARTSELQCQCRKNSIRISISVDVSVSIRISAY